MNHSLHLMSFLTYESFLTFDVIPYIWCHSLHVNLYLHMNHSLHLMSFLTWFNFLFVFTPGHCARRYWGIRRLKFYRFSPFDTELWGGYVINFRWRCRRWERFLYGFVNIFRRSWSILDLHAAWDSRRAHGIGCRTRIFTLVLRECLSDYKLCPLITVGHSEEFWLLEKNKE